MNTKMKEERRKKTDERKIFTVCIEVVKSEQGASYVDGDQSYLKT